MAVSVADQLAEALLWKMAHPLQHSSSMDEALLDYIAAGAPAEITARIRESINTEPEPEPQGPAGARRDESLPGGHPLTSVNRPPEATSGQLFG